VLLSFDDPEADADVTAYVLRGEVDRIRPVGGPTRSGQCRITFNNRSRDFDPPWPGATPGTFGAIRPGQRVQVFWDSAQVFDGHVDDWDHDFPVGGLETATLEASDALARLAQRKFSEWQTSPGQRIGSRLTAALARSEVDWTASTDFDAGVMKLQADLVAAGTNVLMYCQQLERTEGGRFFASRTNDLTYRQVNLAAAPATAVTFTDDGAAPGIYGLVVTYGSEEWHTQVNATRTGGTTQTASSTSGITDLHGGGYRPLNLDDLLMNTDAAGMNLAEYTLSIFEDTTPVITELHCLLDDLSDADGLAVASLEFGDQVEVEWTPTGTGDPADQTLAVEGLSDRFTPALWTRTISLSRLVGLQGWVIGTSQIGTGVLGL
jgi:hypothetical protein